ncbi:MAG: hypothetical protein EAY66_02325 [Sphingobacteriales bacterium]|nr:MAG: hypothetical protein EAY66_02325 [Sphingobacteriales bacterium]
MAFGVPPTTGKYRYTRLKGIIENYELGLQTTLYSMVSKISGAWDTHHGNGHLFFTGYKPYDLGFEVANHEER